MRTYSIKTTLLLAVHFGEMHKLPLVIQNVSDSAARKVDTKVANLLLKSAQKVATFKNRFKSYILDYIFELVPNLH